MKNINKRSIAAKFQSLIGFLFFLILLNSCNNDNPVAPGKPYISSASPEKSYIGGTITLYGTNFGTKNSKTYIIYGSNSSIQSVICDKWNYSMIKFQIPAEASSGTFAVSVNGQISNKINLNIDILPSFELVDIPAGSFTMGSSLGLKNELPTHQTTISNSYQIMKYEVTQLLWNSVMGDNPSLEIGDFLPVNNVSWRKAIEFCNSISEIFNLEACYKLSDSTVTYDTAANGYRLPTEAEWEYACRAGTSGDFGGTGILEDMGWYNGNSGYKPHLCGLKNSNAWSLYDMHGNVWEWSWDWYKPDYYASAATVNPLGPSTGLERVRRGGAWDAGEVYARSSSRPSISNNLQSCGLRLVRTKR